MSEAIITTYSEDDVILKQGDPSRCLYKVLSGSVGLFLNYGQEEEYLVGAVSAPNCFGEMTILAARPNPYTVVALKKDTVLLRVPESNFEVFIQENYQNAIMIMKTMARNLAMVNMNMNLLVEELREMSKRKTVDEDALNRLAEQYGGQFAVSSVPESLRAGCVDAIQVRVDLGVPGSTKCVNVRGLLPEDFQLGDVVTGQGFVLQKRRDSRLDFRRAGHHRHIHTALVGRQDIVIHSGIEIILQVRRRFRQVTSDHAVDPGRAEQLRRFLDGQRLPQQRRRSCPAPGRYRVKGHTVFSSSFSSFLFPMVSVSGSGGIRILLRRFLRLLTQVNSDTQISITLSL